MTKHRYSMPDRNDRTDHAKLAGLTDADICYDDIPHLDDMAWTPDAAPVLDSLHVFPAAKGWTVRQSGSARARGRFATKSEAVTAAIKLARAKRSSMAVHDRDGVIRLFRSFASAR